MKISVKIALAALALGSTQIAAAAPSTPETATDIVEDLPKLSLDSRDQKKGESEEAGDSSNENKVVQREPKLLGQHVIDSGDTLGKIAEKSYGRTRYWRILKLYNQCDPGKLKVGQVIEIPDLQWLLEDAGLTGKLPEVAAGLLKLKDRLSALEDAKGSQAYSEEARKELDELATMVGKLSQTLEGSPKKVKGITKPPYATMKQLRTCRTHLNRLAQGKKDGRKNLNALVHEHLSNSIVYAVLWSRDGFK